MASQVTKITKLTRGQQIEGEVVAITDREIILDLAAKSEGTLSTRDIADSVLKDLKPGDKLKVYVVAPENEYGQIILSFTQKRDDRDKKPSRGYPQSRGIDWPKFTADMSQKKQLAGVVKESNKGGLIVEVEGNRGFIPHSQLGLEFLGKSVDGLIGQQISVSVIEVDQSNNKLVFSQKEAESEAFDKLVENIVSDEVVKGEIVKVSEVGVTVKLEDGLEGFLKSSNSDLATKYEVGKSMSFLVDSVDSLRKRVNLAPFVTSTTRLIYK